MPRNNASKITKYISKLYAKQDMILEYIQSGLNAHQLEMQVSSVEGKILYMLLKLHHARKVLEFGTLAGYSAIWMARALPFNGELHTIEKSEENFQKALANIERSEVANKITVYRGEVLAVLESVAAKAPFDAVFIDADKVNYPRYLEAAYQLLKPGGLIIADNTLLFGLVLEAEPPQTNPELWRAMQEFNEKIADPNRFHSVLLPTDEGLTIAIKK